MTTRTATRKTFRTATKAGKSKGLTEGERASIKDRVRELKAEARPGRGEDKAAGETAVLGKIAEMPRALPRHRGTAAQRYHG